MSEQPPEPFSLGERTKRASVVGVLWVIWAMIFLGALLVVGAAIFLIGGQQSAPTAQAVQFGSWLGYGALGLMVLLTLVGYLVRMSIYKRHWEGATVTPTGYIKGNLMLWAMLEVPVLLAAAGLFVGRTWWPNLLVPALFCVVMALNVPTGRPLQPPPATGSDNPYAEGRS